MTTRIKLRRDTAANWTLNNPILAAGEPGLETDTGKTKYGDGATHWADLSYATGGITARPAVGYFALHGTVPNTVGADWYFESVETDPAGNAYYTGGYEDYDNNYKPAQVVKIDVNGEMVWQKEIVWADGFEGNAISSVYNTATDQLVVVAEMWKMDATTLGAAVITMNPETGAIVGNPIMIRDEVVDDGSPLGEIDPSDIILDLDGNPIVVGHKDGTVTTYALTTASVGETGVIYVDTAIFENRYPLSYNNWYITGTNINSQVSISNINYYENQQLTATASTGTGATFSITNNGAGDYIVDNVLVSGSGYSIGNKITILGTDLGGATPENDATVTVTNTDSSGVVTATVAGTATGTYYQYVGVSGTNIPSGSNATLTGGWRLDTNGQVVFPNWTDHNGFYVNQSGNGYAQNDRLYLNPNQYGGLTSATIVVTQVGGSGEINDFTFTGTFNTSTLKLQVDQPVDFTTEGSWTASNYGSEAFVWTQAWARTIGGSEFDKANTVAQDSAGNIYVACQTYDETAEAPWGYGITLPMLVKLDSSGNKLWSKRFNPSDWWSDSNGYTGVAVDSNDDVYVVETEMITKIDGTGAVLWQKEIGSGDPMSMWNTCVEVDSNDNVYVAAERDFMFGTTNDDFLVVKFDSAGNVLWQRDIGTSTEESASWNNGYQILSVTDDRVYIAGSTYQTNDDVAFAASFPADGSGTQEDHFGRCFYHTATFTVSTTTATVSTVEGLSFTATTVTLTTETNITAVSTSTVNSITVLRAGDTDGRIENLYSISFEDGTVQKSAYTGGKSQSVNGPFIYNTNNYNITSIDAGKMIRWIAEDWNDQVDIYIPHNNMVAFPVGTEIYFMKDKGIRELMFWPNGGMDSDNDIIIMPASPSDGYTSNAFDSGEGWSVHHYDWEQVPCIVTLTKVDTNRWLLSSNSQSHIMDWS